MSFIFFLLCSTTGTREKMRFPTLVKDIICLTIIFCQYKSTCRCRGLCGDGRMVVGFTTTCAISVHHH